MSEPTRMKAVIILPIGEMSKRDIKRLNDNHFCVVEAKDPSKVRFAEPPPNGYSEQEKAAIKLCRWIMAHPPGSAKSFYRSDIAEALAKFFMEGTPLEAIAPVMPAKK